MKGSSTSSSSRRYVNVPLNEEAYQLLKQLKQRWMLRSYSDVILRLHEKYQHCKPSFEHEELSVICKHLDENWESIKGSIGGLIKKLLEGLTKS